MTKLIRFNKPYDVLPQFTDGGSKGSPRATLSDWIDLPGVYPAGRLDRDSEGLMLLTDEGRLQAWISDPQHKMPKTYWVQVEGTPDAAAIQALAEGVELKDGLTRPAKAALITEPDGIWARNPPIRVRKSIPDSWIALTIREGKNRQVRRMTAAVGHPTLRLIRAAIGIWTLDGLAPGTWDDLEAPAIPGPPKPKPAPNRQAIARRQAATNNGGSVRPTDGPKPPRKPRKPRKR
ncbi:pseudouridine synthase [Phaeobacter sp. C3_T13_0]|uniref:pseudouridine synthase n=1 Tax=Phaeobacter cretensis TaxID=3342641 RepID=UPI0039BD5BCB